MQAGGGGNAGLAYAALAAKKQDPHTFIVAGRSRVLALQI